MSGKTCRNGFIFVAAIGLGLVVTSVRAGTNNFLVTPASPTNSASAMFTLEDIYKVLDTRTTNVAMRAGASTFAEPGGEPTNGTMHTLNDIMTLVTNRAPLPKTGRTATYVAGDDGTNRIGVAWPNPRFSPVAANGPETNQIRDNLTGLIWARSANLSSNATFNPGWSSVNGTCTWFQAFDVITNIAGPVNGTAKYGGTNDWRLPNVWELNSLVAWQYSPTLCSTDGTAQWTDNNPFTGVQGSAATIKYWSSTTAKETTNSAWTVSFYIGGVDRAGKTTLNYVWPVRGGR